MEPHPRQCTATSKRSGERCRRWAVAGGKVCPNHGGKAPQVKRAAEQRAAEEKARKAVVTLGMPRVVSPTDALLEEVHRTAGHVAWLAQKVQELATVTGGENAGDHALVWGTTKVVDKGSGESPGIDTTEESRPSVWYQLYERERAHLVKVCEAALKAGVEERRVRLAEAQGELVGGLVQRVLGALFERLIAEGLDADRLRQVWADAVKEIVPREFRALSA